jgi:paraquat-inducible protein B
MNTLKFSAVVIAALGLAVGYTYIQDLRTDVEVAQLNAKIVQAEKDLLNSDLEDTREVLLSTREELDKKNEILKSLQTELEIRNADVQRKSQALYDAADSLHKAQNALTVSSDKTSWWTKTKESVVEFFTFDSPTESNG